MEQTNIECWLKQRGLAFNPFLPLQADQDTRLWMYWVGNADVFDLAWEPVHVCLLAPWGGGKSALRTRLTQEGWSPPKEKRPFPLVYLPGAVHTTLNEHIQELMWHGTRELLLALARHPRRFLEASPRAQNSFARFLVSASPMAHFWLEQMLEENSLAPLNRPYDPGYDLEIPREERQDWLSFILALSRLLQTQEQTVSSADPVQAWEELLFWIEEFLHRPAVYILVDGLDADSSTARDPDAILQVIQPFLEIAPVWAEKHCYIKLFLPAVLHAKLSLPEAFTLGAITWSESLLLELISRRMLAASRGRMDALAALAAPALADLDMRLVHQAPALPRELLLLINRLLTVAVRRQAKRLEEQDLEQALDELQTDGVFRHYQKDAVYEQ